MSAIELLVTIGLIAIMGALALPNLNKSVMNLPVSEEELIAHLRMARASAVSRGVHYRVTLHTNSYVIQRLQETAPGVWGPDGRWPAQEVQLPPGVSLHVTHGDGIIEFDTRGLIEPPSPGDPPEIEKLTIADSREGGSKKIEIYPSGQILEV
jgi:type II secretory pathway pseudopilin PulG